MSTPLSSLLARAVASVMVLGALLGAGCPAKPPAGPPSILLVVLDTVRADAVSAYGTVSDTTPHVDALAERGLKYLHAYAPAPWTVPAHVSLFTGLNVERHRIGVSERMTANAELVMLAERLREGGYETAAFIENPLVGEPFGMNQGFERFSARTLEQLLADVQQPGSSGFDVVGIVDAWASKRRDERPFFVFVNLFEAHEPYQVRGSNPFLPPGRTAADASRVQQSPARICDRIPPDDELAILRALYLGDVAAADAACGAIYERVSRAAGKRRLVTIVTADHGEHIGERRLLDHQFTVANVALHVPLVVEGLEGVAPRSIGTPVTLTDIAPSILEWAGIAAAAELDGRPLPVSPESGLPARDLLSAYGDQPAPSDWPLERIPGETADSKRAHCGPKDRVFGDMAALIRYPYKLNWYARYGSELYDVERDAAEQRDLVAEQPALTEALKAEVLERIERSGLFVPQEHGQADRRTREVLRALGYGD